MSETIKLSIIIISFNTRDILRDCLQSIRDAALACSYEIIVVDNNSADGSVEMIRETFQDVTVIANEDNRFFAKANNQGAAVARGEHLLLLNSDTLVEQGNIEKLVHFLDSSSARVACAGPTVLNPDRTLQSHGYALPSVSERLAMVWRLNRLLPKPLAGMLLPTGTPGVFKGNHRAGWVSGCCMLVRKDVYLSTGGLNEALEFYGEEPEFGYRLHKSGYETWVVTGATIIHLGGQSAKTDQAEFLRDDERSLKRYTILQKHTVGYRKAILMSRIVLFSSYLKRLIGSGERKAGLTRSIARTRKVINLLKEEAGQVS
ncbi:MAG: glycosyltransferase family 2 protein [Candidatus Omnitrophica bacterium]|nr:glycosyltransferase family 2 protein [Candidatus Omnitrophota bacterium]